MKKIIFRDAPEFVPLSTKTQTRQCIGKKKSHTQRRMSKSRLSIVKIDEDELKSINEVEKLRMVNILLVKTGCHM